MIPIGSHQTIEEEISALKLHIDEYRTFLNQEGVWLMLAALGCWGVMQPVFQLSAFVVIFLVFGNRFAHQFKDSRSFSRLVKVIESKIAKGVSEGEAQKASLRELTEVKEELSALKSAKATWLFGVCWLFSGFSFVYCIWQLLGSPSFG